MWITSFFLFFLPWFTARGRKCCPFFPSIVFFYTLEKFLIPPKPASRPAIILFLLRWHIHFTPVIQIYIYILCNTLSISLTLPPSPGAKLPVPLPAQHRRYGQIGHQIHPHGQRLAATKTEAMKEWTCPSAWTMKIIKHKWQQGCMTCEPCEHHHPIPQGKLVTHFSCSQALPSPAKLAPQLPTASDVCWASRPGKWQGHPAAALHQTHSWRIHAEPKPTIPPLDHAPADATPFFAQTCPTHPESHQMSCCFSM